MPGVDEKVGGGEGIGKAVTDTICGAYYSAGSYIVKDMNEQIKRDPRVGSKAKKLNSQFKM